MAIQSETKELVAYHLVVLGHTHSKGRGAGSSQLYVWLSVKSMTAQRPRQGRPSLKTSHIALDSGQRESTREASPRIPAMRLIHAQGPWEVTTSLLFFSFYNAPGRVFGEFDSQTSVHRTGLAAQGVVKSRRAR